MSELVIMTQPNEIIDMIIKYLNYDDTVNLCILHPRLLQFIRKPNNILFQLVKLFQIDIITNLIGKIFKDEVKSFDSRNKSLTIMKNEIDLSFVSHLAVHTHLRSLTLSCKSNESLEEISSLTRLVHLFCMDKTTITASLINKLPKLKVLFVGGKIDFNEPLINSTIKVFSSEIDL